MLPENDTVEAAHSVPNWVKKLPIYVAAFGIVLAYLIYMLRDGVAQKFVRIFKPLHTLFYNKWFFDPLYDRIFVKPLWRIGRFFSDVGDRKIIDRFGPDGFAKLSARTAVLLSRLQTGYIAQYILVMLLGLFAVITWFMYRAAIGY